MFKNQALTNSYIPLKKIELKPEAQVPMSPKNIIQLRFMFPKYLGFIDPKESKIQYEIQMSGRGRPIPNSRAGVHSLWRDVRIQDGTGNAILEEIQDYNVLTAQWWDYNTNDSINNLRTMYEGRSADPSVDDNIYYSGATNWNNAPVIQAQESVKLQIEQPLYSGILGGDKILPLIALSGCRLHMNLDNINRSCSYQTGALGVNDTINQVVGDNSCVTKITKTAMDDAKVNIASEFFITVHGDGGYQNLVNRECKPFNNNPFSIGDMLHIDSVDTTDPLNPVNIHETLGVISGFTKDGDGDLEIKYIPARANAAGLQNTYDANESSVYVLQHERMDGYLVGNVPPEYIAMANIGIDVTLTNIEYICAVVSPPQGYVKKITEQMSGSKGYIHDYKSWTCHRTNLSAINGLTNQFIHSTEQRAYSVLSVPLSQPRQQNFLSDSLQGVTDGCRTYQYVFGSSLIPNLPIELIRYSPLIDGVPRTDALHLIELEKALTNCNINVRNLQRVPERFLIGRAFSKWGQYANLSTHDLTLRVEYSNAVDEKLYNHYICHLRSFIVNSQGINVIR